MTKKINFKLIAYILCFLFSFNLIATNIKAYARINPLTNLTNVRLQNDKENTKVKFKKNLYTGEDIPILEYSPPEEEELPTTRFAMELGITGIYKLVCALLAVLGLTITWDTVSQIGPVVSDLLGRLSENTINALKIGYNKAKGTLTLSKEAITEIRNAYKQFLEEKTENNTIVYAKSVQTEIPGLAELLYAEIDVYDDTQNLPNMLREYSIGSKLTFTDTSTGKKSSVGIMMERGKFCFTVNNKPNPNFIFGSIEITDGISLDYWDYRTAETDKRPFPNSAGVAEAFLVPAINTRKNTIRIYAVGDISYNGEHILGLIGELRLDNVADVVIDSLELPKEHAPDVINGLEEKLAEQEGDIVIGGVGASLQEAITSVPDVIGGVGDVIGGVGDVIGGIGAGIVDSIGSFWDALKDLLETLQGKLLDALESLLNGLLNGLESLLRLLFAPLFALIELINSLLIPFKNWWSDLLNKLPNWELPRIDLFLMYIILIVYRIIMLLIEFYQYCLALYNPATFRSNARPSLIPPQVADAIDFLHGAQPVETDIEWVNTMANGGINLGLSFIDFINLIAGFFLVIKIIKIIRNRVAMDTEAYDQAMADKVREEQKIINGLSTKQEYYNNLKQRRESFKDKYGHYPGEGGKS